MSIGERSQGANKATVHKLCETRVLDTLHAEHISLYVSFSFSPSSAALSAASVSSLLPVLDLRLAIPDILASTATRSLWKGISESCLSSCEMCAAQWTAWQNSALRIMFCSILFSFRIINAWIYYNQIDYKIEYMSWYYHFTEQRATIYPSLSHLGKFVQCSPPMMRLYVATASGHPISDTVSSLFSAPCNDFLLRNAACRQQRIRFAIRRYYRGHCSLRLS